MRDTEFPRPVPPDVLRTARSIAAAQLPGGAIGWPDGHVDPWDHVECAMALSACGLRGPARQAYQWLADTQRADGSWARTTVNGKITDHAAESHHAAYVAVGVWHEFLISADRGFIARMWPVVRDAIGWVLDLQAPRGEVAWERDVAGRPGAFALLSGCSSILHGLCCAIAIAELVEEPQPDWELCAAQLGHVLACHPEAFADKSRFAMDWYYPVLSGALRGAAAASRLADGWDTFVVPGLGVRCVSDQSWGDGRGNVRASARARGLRAAGAGGRAVRRGRAAAPRRRLLLDRLAVRQPGALPRRAQQLDGRRRGTRRRRSHRVQPGRRHLPHSNPPLLRRHGPRARRHEHTIRSRSLRLRTSVRRRHRRPVTPSSPGP